MTAVAGRKYERIVCEQKGAQGESLWITLVNEAMRNALDDTMQRELLEVFEKVAFDHEIRCVVIGAAGSGIAVYGIARESFAIFMAAMVLMGIANAAVQLGQIFDSLPVIGRLDVIEADLPDDGGCIGQVPGKQVDALRLRRPAEARLQHF